MKKYCTAIILFLVFEVIAIWLWLSTGNLFFLLNFSYLGIYGFYASGQCVPAMALREALEGKAEVLTPAEEVHQYYVPLIEKLINYSGC